MKLNFYKSNYHKRGMIMKKLLCLTLSLFTGAVFAVDVENYFPDGSLDKPSDNVLGIIEVKESKPLVGKAGFEKIAVFEKDGGVNNSGCVKVTIDPTMLATAATHNATGLYIQTSNKECKHVIITFDAKWGNAEGGTVTVCRLWGSCEPQKVNLTGDWQKQEVELSSEHPIGAIIFSTLYNADNKGGTFYIDNINVKKAE